MDASFGRSLLLALGSPALALLAFGRAAQSPSFASRSAVMRGRLSGLFRMFRIP